MYLEEHFIDKHELPADHPAAWLEEWLKVDGKLGNPEIHKKEHEDQLKYFGCDINHVHKLTIREKDGEKVADRLYHCMTHLYYWKKTSDSEEKLGAVEKFEKQFNFNLDDLTLPQP